MSHVGCTLILNDPLLAKCGANVTFGNGNCLAAFPSDKHKNEIRNLNINLQTIHEVDWNKMLHNPITRKLLNESNAIFVALQKALEGPKIEEKKRHEIITSTSHKYRSVVSVCNLNLQKALESTDNEELKLEYTSQSELFYFIELIWNLCEVLFIDSTHGGSVLPQLLEWVRWHSNEDDKRVVEVMSFETVHTQPVYWEVVYCFVLQGKMENTRKLLKRNQNSSRDDFRSMDELLRKMPIYQHQSGKSLSDFSLRWKHWQEECSQRLEEGEFSSMTELETLAKILCGHKNTFIELSELCGSWYHYMVSLLLYTNPCIKGHYLASVAKASVCSEDGANVAFPVFIRRECLGLVFQGAFLNTCLTDTWQKLCNILDFPVTPECGNDVSHVATSPCIDVTRQYMGVKVLSFINTALAKECWDTFCGSEVQSSLDHILISAMSFDFTEVLLQLCYFPDSWWFLAHFCDLLFHSKQLKFQDSNNIAENPTSLREFFLLNFSSCLMSHSSLWQIGVDYIDSCTDNGRKFLECYLEKIPLSTHNNALKVLHIAEKRDMKTLANSVCLMMAKQASMKGHVGPALTWAIKTGDSTYVSHLADRFLREYCENGQFSTLDLLDSLGSSMLVSDRLTFLGKYREFHRLYETQQFKMSGDLLISLLASNLAPKYFWMTLLLDSIPLLEAQDLVFSSQQTHQLLYSLQELNPPIGEKIQMLRLSLARNLARAFIEESNPT